MSDKITVSAPIMWDLLEAKHTNDMIRLWVQENQVELKTLGLLRSINALLYTGYTNEKE